MASPEFWETRAGRTWTDVTIPEATRQLHRVADNLALVAEMLERIAKAKDDGGSTSRPATTTNRKR
jgi:hypothetical protein